MKKILFLIVASYLYLSTNAQEKKEILYVGTFSTRGSQGIYAFTFNRAKRTLTPLQTIPSLESPTYLAVHPSGKFLYSVNRGKADAADNGGSVSAYGIDPKAGTLSGLNHRPSYGADPCHISFDKSGNYALISNYNEGNLVILPIFDDGLLGNPSDSKKYTGNSIDSVRQASSHIHSSLVSPDGKFLYVADLGTDKIYTYQFDANEGKMLKAQSPEVSVAPGAGPRHFTFHPNGKFIYLAEELTSTVSILSVNKTTGALTIVEDTIPSLPTDFKARNSSADIHTDPKGKYLYMSNRGLNAISIYSILPTGKIKFIGIQDTGGKTPRNFMIDPKGEFLFVANQDTDTIVMYRINPKTGKLTLVGKPVKVPSPVCLKMFSLTVKR
jgi:6-phosphogluconolactonase